jgi:elongation factor Ts
MLDCKNALKETDGDLEEAVQYLEKKGIAEAKKKSGRVASEGLVNTWINDDATEGILVEINCETDFVSRNDQFQEFAENVTAAIGESDVSDADELDDLMVDEVGETVEDYTVDTISEIGENINIRRFTRLEAPEGFIGSYIHAGEQIGVLLEVSITGDKQRDEVEAFTRDVAMHIAAMEPDYLKSDEIPESDRDEQKDVFAAQMEEEGKPEHIIPQIVEGKMEKWFSEVTLLGQPFVKDTDKSVQEYADDVGGLEINGFVRYEVGEGIETDDTDFNEEVAEQLDE